MAVCLHFSGCRDSSIVAVFGIDSYFLLWFLFILNFSIKHYSHNFKSFTIQLVSLRRVFFHKGHDKILSELIFVRASF